MIQATRFSSASFPRTTAYNFIRHAFAVMAIFAVQLNIALAQEQPDQRQSTQTPQTQGVLNQPALTSPPADQKTVPSATVTMPAGTKLQLGLARALSVKKTKPGDSAYMQVTFPVSVGSKMLVPPGTYLQGTIGKIVRRDRTRALLEFELSSASLIYSTGYTVSFPGTIDAAPTWAQMRAPRTGDRQNVPPVGAMAATGTTPPPVPTPSLGNAPRNALIAVGIAAAAGVALLALAVHHSDVYMEVGTTIQIVLPAPLIVDRDRVAMAVQQYSIRAAINPPPIVLPPLRPKLCYDPGTLGTPDIVIPGMPATPPTVIPGGPGMPDTVIPGIPATPDTVIPGTPGTPGGYYPFR